MAILDAARTIMSERGFEGLTMRAVADRIEYTAAALYKHFGDREALVRELCAHDFYEFTQALRSRPGALLIDPADPYAQLRAIGHGYVEFAISHPEQYRVMFMSPVPPDLEVMKSGNPEQDAYATCELAARAAIERGCFPGMDSHLVAQTAWATVHGVVSIEIAHMCNKKKMIPFAPLSARVETALEGILAGLEIVAARNAKSPATKAAAKPPRVVRRSR